MPLDAPAYVHASGNVSAETEALILDLVEWIAKAPRPYEEVMDAWRTSCPRLPVWETACDRRYLVRERGEVRATAAGLAELRRAGRLAAPAEKTPA